MDTVDSSMASDSTGHDHTTTTDSNAAAAEHPEKPPPPPEPAPAAGVGGPRTAPTYSVVDAVMDKEDDGPGPRCGHTLTAVAAVGDEGTPGYVGPRLILFGGATALEGNSGAASGTPSSAGSAGIRLAGATADVHCYDVLTNKWSRITPFGEPPTPRAAHVATAVGTMVVIQGGIGPAGLSAEDLHVLDLTQQRPRWHRVVVQGPGPGPRYGHVMALVGQRYLMAIGGNDGKRPLADVWALDTAAKPYEWRKLEPEGEGPPPCMYATASARSDGLLLLCGGRDANSVNYAREIDEHRRTLLLVNKADLLPYEVRDKWAKYFRLHGILFLFWSAKAATAVLEGKTLGFPTEMQESDDTKIYGREELLARLQSEAEEIAMTRRKHSPSVNISGNASKSSVVGFVGYPNVGKSSTINALVGEKRTGVTSTPGKTKHFQTLIISDELTLCDCPGLVFPSFTSSRYEMVASGVLPIDRMTEHREAVQVVANRVPRHAIEDVYKITLPKPKSYELQSRAPLASELLRAYCASRGYVASSGLPDETKAARIILKDYIDGKLPHFQMPPGTSDEESISSGMHESDSSDCEGEGNSEDESRPSLEHALNDLSSFDVANGMGLQKVAPVKKKPAGASHKQHRKPQRKKDRSWRVNGDGDGMPVARVFQKPVNTGPLKVG